MSRINVPIVVRSAVAALPAPYSKRAHTFRTAGGNSPAARARLGSPSFVSFNVASVVPSGLVRKLATECRPTRVEHRFSHPCLSEVRGIHIADGDKFILSDNPGRLFVEVVTARISYLGVDRLGAPLVSGALCRGKLHLVGSVVLQGGDGVPVAACGESFQTEVNADHAVPGRKGILNLALKSDVPAPTRVLRETPGFYGATKVARVPEVEGALQISYPASINLHGAGYKWHPAECSLGATGSTETRAMFGLVSSNDKLAADCRHGIGMQSKFTPGTCAEFDKIEGAGPASGTTCFPAVLRFTLDLAAIVPNLINCPRMEAQVFPDAGVLDAVTISEDHDFGSFCRCCGGSIKGPGGASNAPGPAAFNWHSTQHQEAAALRARSSMETPRG